jgi:predicted transcriptional regulator
MPDELGTYLSALGRERRRAMVIHAAPAQAQALNGFARRAAEQLGGSYLDLLGHFRDHEELAAEVDTWGPTELLEFLKQQSTGQRLLVVDRGDFLLDSWRKSERKAFYRLVDIQWDGYVPATATILVFCLQRTTELEGLSILDSHGDPRVRPVEDFQALD